MIQYILMGVFCLGAIGIDQLSKYWVVSHISANTCSNALLCTEHIAKLKECFHLTDQSLANLPEQVNGIPGIFHLTHTHNTGAAFSSFEGQHWLFVLVMALFLAFIIWEFPKKRMGFKPFERWMLVSILAGGIGNMIDRLRLGFVVDMIEVEFIDFAIFNVADIFITCGCILLIAHLIFFNKDFWKEEKK